MTSGQVIVRSDTPTPNPEGAHVLMHELGHAVGLDPAANNADALMSPSSRP